MNVTPKAQAIREKTGKLNYTKIKNFCAPKDIIYLIKS